MDIIDSILLVLAGFIFMEFIAWFTHKYVMHGFLWILHKDHHIRDGRKLELNDWFALFFSVPSILLIYIGSTHSLDYRFWLGIGIMFYGLAYFMFHDIYVHQRIPILKKHTNRYLRATMKAHLDHHKPNVQSNFGFLLAPLHYYVSEFNRKN
ncbi:MAG: sterol desaturase family protein [Bacteroidetes bacterium]|nr:sterol desaturase family protein [Bacteroidota bacterium]